MKQDGLPEKNTYSLINYLIIYIIECNCTNFEELKYPR